MQGYSLESQVLAPQLMACFFGGFYLFCFVCLFACFGFVLFNFLKFLSFLFFLFCLFVSFFLTGDGVETKD